MTTTAFKGSLSQLKIGDGASPEVFTTVFEVTNIGEFGQENDLIEVTHMQSTAKEYIYGLPDGRRLSISVNYNPTNATHVALLAAQAAGTTRNMKLTLPPGGGSLTFSFAALIISWSLPLGPNVAGVMTFDLKLSGAITGPV
jgi:hypothetical protein